MFLLFVSVVVILSHFLVAHDATFKRGVRITRAVGIELVTSGEEEVIGWSFQCVVMTNGCPWWSTSHFWATLPPCHPWIGYNSLIVLE